MNFAPSSISCGVNQLYDLAGDHARKLHAAILTKVRNQIQANQADNQYIRTEQRKPVTFETIRDNEAYYSRLFPAHYVFSDADRNNNGERFEKFLAENNMGKVVKCESRLNVNSSNMITTWIWVVDKAQVMKWFCDHSFPDGTYMMSKPQLGAELKRLEAQVVEFQKSQSRNGCKCQTCTSEWDRVIKQAEEQVKAIKARIASLGDAATETADTPPPAMAATA